MYIKSIRILYELIILINYFYLYANKTSKKDLYNIFYKIKHTLL